MQMTAVSVAVAAGALATSAFAAPPEVPPAQGSSDPEVAQLRALVKDLQGEVDALKAENDDNWLTEKRATEIRGLVQDVLADADTRASLLQSGVTAGWDKGFFIASADGNFKLKIGGQVQVRFVYNFQDDEASSDSNRSGFEIRRAKLILTGNVFDPSWTFDVQFAADRATGIVTLEDAGWIQKDFGNGLKVRVGQMKAPFLREEILSSRVLFAVERSLLNSFFTAGTVQGAQLSYDSDRWRVAAMFHDGNRSANTAWSMEDTEFAMSARAEYLAIGDKFSDAPHYTGFRGAPSSLLLGAAVNWSKSEFGTGSNLPPPDFNNNEVTNTGLTIDATFLASGWSIAGAFVYRSLDPQTGASLDQTGFMARGGYFVADDWEIFGQYEWADADIAGIDDLSVITLGVNKYWDKHNLKWQTDIGIGLNEVNAVFASDGAGWRADPVGSDGQVVVRSQIQLLF